MGRKSILYMGPSRPRFVDFISAGGDKVTCTDAPLENEPAALEQYDFIISYGYRFIIGSNIIDHFRGRAINLHCSLLPWNRGADPNLWSFLEDTPKGVTIHALDYGIDTGAVLVQKEVGYLDDDTLRSSYDRLARAMEELFQESWGDIRGGRIKAVPQPLGGSFHRLKDRARFEHLLTNGWDTPVRDLIGKALNTASLRGADDKN